MPSRPRSIWPGHGGRGRDQGPHGAADRAGSDRADPVAIRSVAAPLLRSPRGRWPVLGPQRPRGPVHRRNRERGGISSSIGQSGTPRPTCRWCISSTCRIRGKKPLPQTMIAAGPKVSQRLMAQSVGGLKLLTMAQGFDKDFEDAAPQTPAAHHPGPMYSAMDFTLQSGPISEVLEGAKRVRRRGLGAGLDVEDMVATARRREGRLVLHRPTAGLDKLDPVRGIDTGGHAAGPDDDPAETALSGAGRGQDPPGTAGLPEVRGRGRGAVHSGVM
jgi:hypothetical protein